MPVFAAVDIGSNSCRLKIARVQQHALKTLHEDREVTRLGESVFASGIISPEAMANTIEALKRFHRAVQAQGADRIRVVATSATRDARNAQAFLAWVKSATGWKVEVISGQEEGRLIHMGVMGRERLTRGRVLLIDLGGGSCEIILSEQRRIKEMVSLPLGAVRLTQDFLQNDPPSKEEIARMRQFIARELRRAQRRFSNARVSSVIATSGTAAALAEASLAMSKSKATVSNARTSSAKLAETTSVRRLADRLAKLDEAKRAAVPGIGPKRAEIIVAGANVYAELLERLCLGGFRYSQYGLRDGILQQMLAEQDNRTRAHLQFEADRWESVLELCARYGVDLRQVEPVCVHVEQLFNELKSVHQLPPEYGLWLKAAAMLSDLGKFVNYQGRHRHTQYVVANSELYGFTPEQRALVSAIARYTGKSRPEDQDRVMREVRPEEHERVQRAIVLLRLALALNQDRASDVLRVRTRTYPKRVMIIITPGRTGAELELWSLQRERSYFLEVFRRELFATLA